MHIILQLINTAVCKNLYTQPGLRTGLFTAGSFLYCDERTHQRYFSVFHYVLTTYTRRRVVDLMCCRFFVSVMAYSAAFLLRFELMYGDTFNTVSRFHKGCEMSTCFWVALIWTQRVFHFHPCSSPPLLYTVSPSPFTDYTIRSVYVTTQVVAVAPPKCYNFCIAAGVG